MQDMTKVHWQAYRNNKTINDAVTSADKKNRYRELSDPVELLPKEFHVNIAYLICNTTYAMKWKTIWMKRKKTRIFVI